MVKSSSFFRITASEHGGDSSKPVLCTEQPPEPGCAGRACSKHSRLGGTHLDGGVTHGYFPQRGLLQGEGDRRQAAWAGSWEVLPRMPGGSVSFKCDPLLSWTCVFLCAVCHPDNFQLARRGCEVAKADSRYKRSVLTQTTCPNKWQ